MEEVVETIFETAIRQEVDKLCYFIADYASGRRTVIMRMSDFDSVVDDIEYEFDDHSSLIFMTCRNRIRKSPEYSTDPHFHYAAKQLFNRM